MHIEAVAFDMDGLMLDTENLTFEIYREVIKETGRELTLDLFKQTIGIRTDDTKILYEGHFKEGFNFDDIAEKCRQRFWQIAKAEGIQKKKGIVQLLEYLKSNKIPCAVATSTRESSAAEMLKTAGIYNYFSAFVYGDMVKNGKPAPDIYLLACERLGTAPENTLGLEDSYNGIRALHKAGLIPLMVPDILQPTEEIETLTYRVCNDLTQVIDVIEDINKK